jgi:uncharacterized cofD-like protein
MVALGGGHGLFASLSALRRLSSQLTAVVTVADDGGSSGRIRRELGVLPPGDLRMALAALAGRAERDRAWTGLYQHRFGGTGALAGHPVGNLILTGLLEQMADPVEALAVAAEALGAVGRVLPMSSVPLDLVAQVEPNDPDDPVRSRRIRGQSAIATTPGRVRRIALEPPHAPACPAAVAAVRAADVVVLGPGSWFTSVIPHLLVRDLARALVETSAEIIVTLNLAAQAGETDGFSPSEHLRVLREYCPDLRVSAVVADEQDANDLVGEAKSLDAQLVSADVRSKRAHDRHDPIRLADAIARAVALTGRSGKRRTKADTEVNAMPGDRA